MSAEFELVPFTTEKETTSERFFWDSVLRCMEALAKVCEGDEDLAFDLHAELEELKDEDQEDALTRVLNYSVMITTPEGASNDLQVVEDFLKANGLIE